MMTLYELCQEEMYGRSVLSTQDGFVVYKEFPEDVLYIHLIFVRKEKRKLGLGNKLFTELLRKTSPKTVIGYVDKTATNHDLALSIYKAHGAKILKESKEAVTFYKDI